MPKPRLNYFRHRLPDGKGSNVDRYLDASDPSDAPFRTDKFGRIVARDKRYKNPIREKVMRRIAARKAKEAKEENQ